MTPPDPTLTPACEPALALLQCRLDGESVPVPADIEAHLAACVDCRERFLLARSLVAMWPRPAEAAVPTGEWTERLVGAIVADGRMRRLRRLAGAWALAAGVLVAVWLARPGVEPPVMPIGQPNSPIAVENGLRPGPKNLRDGFAEAGSALAAWTRRAASETVSQGRLLVPRVAVRPSGQDAAVDPLGEARQGLTEGLEPITTSARRAVNLFWRELPEIKN